MIDIIGEYKKSNLRYPLIEIKGGLAHLYEQITAELKQQLVDLRYVKGDQILVVIKNFTSDIERYIQTAELIDNTYTFAAVEYTLEQDRFRFVPKVTEMGDYSRLGDVISFWPIGYANPIRIEFFDEKIEKMYQFDAVYSRKLDQLAQIFVSRIDMLDDKVEWENINIRQLKDSEGNGNPEDKTHKTNSSKYGILSSDDFFNLSALAQKNLLLVNFGQQKNKPNESIQLDLSYPALFFSRMDLFSFEIERYIKDGWKIQIETVHQELIPEKFHKHIVKRQNILTAGFINAKSKIAYYTDRELFGTIFITKEKQKKLNSSEAKKLLDYIEGEIEIGDYIVHSDHGIGIYSGIAREKGEDYLQIKYAEGDELLIPFDQIHKITKYIGVSNEPPQVTRLNKVNWKEVTRKARKLIGIIAKDLASHYAKIELSKAHQIAGQESDEYKQFVAGFGYEETVDQKRTIKEVMTDLAQDNPMNRLIVGDVGFGKTEVAMRAAFKVVERGFQIAILAPTTVLAAQHFKVFTDRFAKFDVKIGMLSRFTKGEESKKNIDLLNEGKLDIVIGTHRLLSSDIKFKNLGLIIIDEEQKFGVSQKEKLKKLKYGAHILSMTATPIPRTLSMALSQIQDISIISTPPQGRKSVKTEVEKFDWDKVRNAIKFEKDRNGQIYFVHNRVETINSIYQDLSRLIPGIRFAVAHAQMDERKLEQVINDFYAKKYDCLICTTIIENGIDMPNVNTIVINKAQNFGLGQLYQLRGRVGRSKRQAFAYLFYDGEEVIQNEQKKHDSKSTQSITKDDNAYYRSSINDPMIKDSNESDEKEKVEKNTKYIERLKAIMESQELGAGFKIASRDLEIRGAGNLLGREQHGQISKVGLALYMQMLAEEIEKVKNEQIN